MPDLFTPQRFIAKWRPVQLPERAASQEYFIDLCRLLGQPTPAEHDATGAEYTFEKGVTVTGAASRGSRGESGYADVWWRGKFGWEYKRRGKYRDLNEAYRQLCQYREALDNPPLLIVSDIARTEIHTNFTGTRKEVHAILLEELDQPENLNKLRRVFTDPDSFRPQLTTQHVTEEVAEQIGRIAQGLRDRGHDPHVAAHFLMKCMFCLFAEDVRLLPAGIFKRLLERGRHDPERVTPLLTQLFARMSTGGDFGTDEIAWFNGGLFDASAALDLTEEDVGIMLDAAVQDWGAVEPAIFGTLFERSLDPGKRAQIGAHYTSREDIMLIVGPVVMAPLRREWQEAQQAVADSLERRNKAKTKETKKKAETAVAKVIEQFLDRLASVRILDPACGSGNFLYVAIQQLLNLEKEVITFAARPDIAIGLFPRVRPTQLHGIEINPYASELAQVVIWIGYLQWMRDNGFVAPRDPILEPLTTVECRDAILDTTTPELPVVGQWPETDFIIGNPPFAGRGPKRRLLTAAFGPAYVRTLNSVFHEQLKPGADLCCYWFELARRAIEQGRARRAGLLATQGIRGGTNREVLDRVKDSGDIFFAISDRVWALDGAMVHVSLIGFDDGAQLDRLLDGEHRDTINSDLTCGTNVTQTYQLHENSGLAFQGIIPGRCFDPPSELGLEMLRASGNPNGLPNTRVLKRWANGADMLDTRDVSLIVDFSGLTEAEASQFEMPFQFMMQELAKARADGITSIPARYWLHWRLRGDLRQAIREKCRSRFLATPRTSKHRLFTWVDINTLPSDGTVAITAEEDYMFGVLSSSVHEHWSISKGTQLREEESGKRYSHTMTFRTFPFPWPPGNWPEDNPIYQRIAAAAQALYEQRERWLNPPEWIDPIATQVDAVNNFADLPADARSLIRQSAIMAAAAQDIRLQNRTLTNLYNERPGWLRIAHEQLDRAVLAAYAFIDTDGGWSEDWVQVWTDSGAGKPLPDNHPLVSRRREIDEHVLANLLRMNLARGGP